MYLYSIHQVDLPPQAVQQEQAVLQGQQEQAVLQEQQVQNSLLILLVQDFGPCCE